MEAVQGARTSVETRIDSVITEVSLLRTDLWNISTRVKEVEDSTASLQGDTKALKTQVGELQALTNKLQAQSEDHKGQSRRNNISIVGVLESAEGLAVDLFVKDLILKELQPRGQFFLVEHTHRVPGAAPSPGTPPQPVIARIFNFQDCDVILQIARSAPPVQYEKHNYNLFSRTSRYM
ncbi:hypothetical protein NDU88_008482 [Pleurodeles waltl]|uniref:Uncharacterized protein n=1 Tax=Pleurodeles waltl TaxID=8319 RepID=A0AAV7N8K1_PLEWA|nr:hypothetical protein NDU88_008482 [Pleurodeles waltl]